MKHIILLITILLFFAYTTKAQQDSSFSFSLKQAKDYAIKHNTNIINAQIDAIIAKKKIWETTAIGLPQVSGSVQHQYFIDIPVTLIPAQIFNPQAPAGSYMEMKFGTDNNTKAGLNISQLIFSGEYIVGLQASKIFSKLSKQNLQKSEIDIKEQITNTYNLILFAKKNKEIIDSNIVYTEDIIKQTKEILKQGFIDQTKLDQLNLNLTNLKNTLNSINKQIEITKNLLKIQLGIDINSNLTLTDNYSNIFNISDLQALSSNNIDITNQIDYQILNTQEHLQGLNVKRKKATFLPQISAFYNHQESLMNNDFLVFDKSATWYHSNLIGVNINIPIFSSGMRLSQVSQENLMLEKIRNSKKLLEKNLSIAVIQAKIELSNNINTYNQQLANVKLSKKILDNNKIKYKNGTITSLEFTQALIQNISAQQQLNKTIFDLINSQTKLNKILGTI